MAGVMTGNGSGPQRPFKSCCRVVLNQVHEGLWRDSYRGDFEVMALLAFGNDTVSLWGQLVGNERI